MNKLYDWLHGARWRMSFGHSLEALLFQFIFALPFWALGVSIPYSAAAGAIMVAVYFYSREKSQYEQRVKVEGESNTSVTFAGLFPGSWGQDSLLDWVFPVVTSSAIAVGLFYLHKFNHGIFPTWGV